MPQGDNMADNSGWLDVALGVGYVRTAAVIGFTANEALSIIENAGLMGIKLPGSIRRAIDVLLKRGGDKDDDKKS